MDEMAANSVIHRGDQPVRLLEKLFRHLDDKDKITVSFCW